MRKITPLFVAVAAIGLAAGNSALAATYTVTAVNSQSATTYPGATTFADSSTFAGYGGIVTTSVATITGGALNPGGSTNPGSGFDGSIANYLAAPSDITITFNGNQKYFGLLWGSVDTTNTVSFYEGSTLLASYTGGQLESSIGLQGYPANGSFVGFLADGASADFDKVVLSAAGGDPFESVNYAAAVPEPAAWAMLILGMAGLGGVLRRRRDGALAAA
jgi:hypothetical protein